VLSETRRGKKSAVIANYRFREYRTLADGHMHFRCCNKKCKASVHLRSNGTSLESKGVHNHLPYDDHHVKREEVRTCLKRKAEDEPHTKPNKLVRREVGRTEDGTTVRDHADVACYVNLFMNVEENSFHCYPKRWTRLWNN